MIAVTSLQAYHTTEELRASQAEYILQTIKKATHPSSRDLERFTNIPRSSVTARLNKLEKDGRIVKGGTKIDALTKKTVCWYKAIE